MIYAHLLRQIAALSEADQHFLVHWLKKSVEDLHIHRRQRQLEYAVIQVCVCVCVSRLSVRRFKQLVERLLQFISSRLFPADPEELPPLSRCSWWIPAATKVLSLFSEFSVGRKR